MPGLRPRFELLDGLRGIAAILVVQRHCNDFLGLPQFSSSYLSVDLFFILSGFVIAHAYEQKLRGSITANQFIVARGLRLLPMYWFGLIATVVILFLFEKNVAFWPLAASFAINSLFLPAPSTLNPAGPFLLKPSWSLFGEAIANIVYSKIGRIRSHWPIILPMAFGMAIIISSSWKFGNLDRGFEHGQLYIGIGRVFFSFFAGVLVFRFRALFPKCGMKGAVMVMGIVVAALCMPSSPSLRPWYDPLVVGLLFPLVVGFAWSAQISGSLQKLCIYSGTASYPLYVLHVPAKEFLVYAVPIVSRFQAVWLAPWIGIAFLIGLISLALLLERYFDAPLREYVKRRFLTKRQSAGAEVSPL